MTNAQMARLPLDDQKETKLSPKPTRERKGNARGKLKMTKMKTKENMK